MLLPPPTTGHCQALGSALCITHMNVLKYNFGETVAFQPAYFGYPIPLHDLNPDLFFSHQGLSFLMRYLGGPLRQLHPGLWASASFVAPSHPPYLCPIPISETSDCGPFPPVCSDVSVPCLCYNMEDGGHGERPPLPYRKASERGLVKADLDQAIAWAGLSPGPVGLPSKRTPPGP